MGQEQLGAREMGEEENKPNLNFSHVYDSHGVLSSLSSARIAVVVASPPYTVVGSALIIQS
jgi:hypothetical protein